MPQKNPVQSPTSLGLGDISASLLVFLISLPLSMAIAIASGLPPAAGLGTGIIGGLIAAPFGGSPFQISGPAAGLTVIVAGIVARTGAANLGATVAFAGILQLSGSFVNLAQWFRAVPPSVIKGMLSGIGILIFASQFHVMFDDESKETGLANILSMPGTVLNALVSAPTGSHDDAAIVALTTLGAYLFWQHVVSRKWPAIPAVLVAVGAGSALANMLHLPVHFVQIPQNIFSSLPAITLPTTVESARSVLANACLIAYIATCETLLTASALDKMHNGKRTDFNKELRGQGVGNLVCGIFSCLPMTGVMVRSGANIAGGATSKFSSILVGLWLLIFTAFFTSVVSYIPVASLAALLVYMGFQLANISTWKEIARFGRSELTVYLSTVGLIVTFDLLTGIIAGLVLSVLKLVHKFTILELELTQDTGIAHLWLRGSATFLRLPKLHETLEQVLPQMELHIHLEDLDYIDHACLDLILAWDGQAKLNGGRLVMDWTTLTAAFRDRRRTIRSNDLQHPALAVAFLGGGKNV